MSRSFHLSTIAALLATTSVLAQGVPVRPGEVVERISSVSAPAQSYAVYLPNAYSTDRTWPVLFLMDPRGRALVPLERLRPVAERFGYIMMSSYNTASDVEVDPNVDAVNAMIADGNRAFALDTRRYYLVGFSGTAREGWNFGYQLSRHVAGLVGVGAGLPPGMVLPDIATSDSAPFDFFGGAGVTDFNYEEVLGLDNYLTERRIPHRIRYYPGGHGWAPEAVMTEAVEWLEVRAMARGLAPRREPWLDSLYRRRFAAADSLALGGSRYAAWLGFASLAQDFRGLRDVDAVGARAGALGRTKDVKRVLSRNSELREEQREAARTLRLFLERLRAARKSPSLAAALEELQVRRWQRAARERDTVAAYAAARRLEDIMVMTSYYGPRDYLAAGDGARALALLDIAEAIRPGLPHVCEARAKALRLLGRGNESTGCPGSGT